MAIRSGIAQLDDFSGGLVTKASVIKLEQKYSPKCLNVWGNIFGSLNKRAGYTKLNSASQSATNNGLFVFIRNSSTKLLMGVWGTSLKKMDAGASGWDGTWDSVTLAATVSASRHHWDVFKKAGQGTLLFTSEGRDFIQSYDGTTVTLVAGAPKCKQVLVWNNHVWAANVDAFLMQDDCDSVWDVNTQVIDAAEAAWTASTNVVAATDPTDFKEGTYAAKLTIADAFATGLAAYYNLASAVNLSTYAYVNLWIKSSVNTNAGDLRLYLDDTAGCTSTIENLQIPALTANTWTQVQLTLAAAGSDTAIASVGIYVQTDNGAQTVWVDDIRAVKSNRQYIKDSTDHGDKKVGDTSLIVDVTVDHTTGIVAINNYASQLDISGYTYIDFWAKSSYDSSGDANSGLQILLDDSTDCSSATTKETLTIPVMAANTWTYHQIALANATNDTAIRSIALKIATDKGAQIIHIDHVRVTYTEPDKLQRSALAFYDDWTGTDSGYEDIFTANDVGLTGIATLRGYFFVFKRKSVHVITYQGGRPLLSIKQVKSTIGTISPETVLNVDIPGAGEHLMWLGADRQLYSFDGTNSTPLSEQIQTSNGESTVYMNNINSTTGVDAALGMCHAMNIPDLHWYVLFVPQGASATACTHAIVYDYLAKAFWAFDSQAFTNSFYGDNGIGTDTPFVAGTNYCWTWNSGNTDDGTTITSYWESAKLAMSKAGRPMLKKVRYVEGNSKVNGTESFTFSYRIDWASSYTAATAITQSVNQWSREVSQCENLLQLKIGDSATGAAWELYSLDLVGEELAIGR